MKFLEKLEPKRKLITLIVKICAVVFTFLFGVITVGGSIMLENSAAVNDAFGIQTTRVEKNEDPNIDTTYYKSENSSVAETRKKGLDIVTEVMEEGATLLKNVNNALPLKKGAKISLYSASSVEPIITGTGSSGSSNSAKGDDFDNVSLKDAFEGVDGANIKVNPELWNFYDTNRATYLRQKSGAWGAYFSIRDAEWSKIPSTAKDNGYGDAAIFVLSRRSGEGNDMASYYGNQMTKDKWGLTNDMTNGNYLALSPTEISVLKGLKAMKDSGKVSSIIVLMNSANPVQCDFADNAEYGVDALLWCGTLGDTGSVGVANVMAGKKVPSGRLSDTFWKYHWKNPVNANFAIDMYHEKEWSERVPTTWLEQMKINSSDSALKAVMEKDSRSTVYAEGIYVGYRYTETRYEDKVFGRAQTGAFDYYDTVSYPFGYGLSYSKFEYSNFKMERIAKTGKMDDTVYEFSVDVKNVGDYDGKEVVQLYLQKPYTNYDKTFEIEKASVELVAFEKTDVIKKGETVTVKLSVKERELASYDYKNARTYIVDEGDYYFTAAKDAHDAINNIIKKKDASAATVAQGNTGLGNAELVASQKVSKRDTETYSVTDKAKNNGVTSTLTEITNQFDEADILYYNGAVSENFRYITRSDWEGTVKYGFDASGKCLKTQTKVTVTNDMFTDRKEAMSNPKPSNEGKYPNMGINNSPASEGHLNLIDLRVYSDENGNMTDEKIRYNDSLWDTLLDQLTWEEMTYLLSEGWRLTRGIESIAKPNTIDFNGSVGLVANYAISEKENHGLAVTNNDKDKKQLIGYYPCNGISASTYNKELMLRYGRQWGEDSLWSGSNGLYGMGLNLHRSPYGGRNFEYYSEDPYLMGMISAKTVIGAAEKGMYCYLKHCVLNEQETYRIGGYCWLTEQTMREIYLKPFQIAIEDGGASCVMTAEPALGVRWSGQQGFVQTVLRNEFGMTGIAVSDYTRDVDGNYLQGLLAGSDLPDGTINNLFDGIDSEKGYAELANCMRESTKHILYTVVHSNAMNGFNSDTRVIVITPAWIPTVKAFTIVMTVLFAISAASLLTVVAWDIYTTVSKRKKDGKTAG